MDSTAPTKYLTVNEVALTYRVTPRTIRSWMSKRNKHPLPSTKVQGRVLINPELLEKWVETYK